MTFRCILQPSICRVGCASKIADLKLRTKMHACRFFVLSLVLCASAFAQKGQFALPEGAEIEKYPIKNYPLTGREQAELGLSPKTLIKEQVFQNHFRKLGGKGGRFVLETLKTGTLVLVDNAGNPRYKADCGNRLVGVPEGFVSSKVTYSSEPVGLGDHASNNSDGWHKKFANAIWGFIGNMPESLGLLGLGLLGLAILLLLIGGFLYLLVWLGDRISNLIRHRPRPAILVTPITPRDSVQSVVPPVSSTPSVSTSPTPSQATHVPTPVVATPAQVVTPTEPHIPNTPSGRSFMSFADNGDGQPHMIKWSGMKTLVHEHQDGVHTVRFTRHGK